MLDVGSSEQEVWQGVGMLRGRVEKGWTMGYSGGDCLLHTP